MACNLNLRSDDRALKHVAGLLRKAHRLHLRAAEEGRLSNRRVHRDECRTVSARI